MKGRFKKTSVSEDHFLCNLQDILHYRRQYGVNLGSWFVLERWIAEKPFSNAKSPAQSDLDVAHGSNAKHILENHWDTWITEEDWKYISEMGINTVRIPVGYYHLCGADPSVLHGTDFEPYFETYRGAWDRILRAVQIAHSCGLGVLIDLHAAPGKQNNDSHAGTSDRANFFGDPHNQRRTIDALCALVKHLTAYMQSFNPPLHNFVGVQLLNEPNPPNDSQLQSWYTSCIVSIRAIAPTLPIYLGECWRTDSYVDYVAKHPSSSLTVLDHHLYRCFTDSDIHTSAEEHSRALEDPSGATNRMLTSASEKLGCAGGGIVVGEWSAALNPGSLRGSPGEQRRYVDAQLKLFESRCAGWFFWTYKKERGGDKGWCFRDAVAAGIFPDTIGVRHHNLTDRDDERTNAARDEAGQHALNEHARYWSQFQGSYDHSRFAYGFQKGWDDACQFILSTPPGAASVTRIGFRAAWASRRTSDRGKNYWEFEHGFLQGIDKAEARYIQTQ